MRVDEAVLCAHPGGLRHSIVEQGDDAFLVADFGVAHVLTRHLDSLESRLVGTASIVSCTECLLHLQGDLTAGFGELELLDTVLGLSLTTAEGA